MNYMRGTYTGVQPVASAESATSGGPSTGAIVAIVAGAVIVVGLVIWLVLRRRPREVEGA